MDAPAHMRQRSMVEPVFVKDHVETMRPYIQKTVDDLLDKMIEKGCAQPVDLVANFALPVPSFVSLIQKTPKPDAVALCGLC
jgi:fungal nitric oxide reductase